MSAVDRLLQAQLNALDLGLSQGTEGGVSKGSWQTQRKRVEIGEAAVCQPQQAAADGDPRAATQITSSTSIPSARATDAHASSESHVVMSNSLNGLHHHDRGALHNGGRGQGGNAQPAIPSSDAVQTSAHPSDGPQKVAFTSRQGSPAVRSTSLSSSSASSSSTSSPQMGRAGMSTLTQSPKADPKPKRVFKAMTKIDKEKERAISIAFGDLGRLKPPAPTEELNDRLSASLNDLNLFGRSGN